MCRVGAERLGNGFGDGEEVGGFSVAGQQLTAKASWRRKLTVTLSAVLTVALLAGYTIADALDAVPGYLTYRPQSERTATLSSAMAAVSPSGLVGDIDTTKAVDATAAQKGLSDFLTAEGVGKDISVIVADATGKEVVSSAPSAAREPASTLKTLTGLAAVTTLDMNTTLETQVYVAEVTGSAATVVLRGSGDMLLGSGASDADHVNGHAGLQTLAQEAVAQLKKRGITSVTLKYDDTLFGASRTPADMPDRMLDLGYFTPVSSMAVDEGKQWGDLEQPDDPDAEPTVYPARTSTPAAQTAETFATKLKAAGMKVSGSVGTATVPASAVEAAASAAESADKDSDSAVSSDTSDNDATDNAATDTADATSAVTEIASVSSAPLWQVVRFSLQTSDNTIAELLGRLVALETHADNSPEGAVSAVLSTVKAQGVEIEGLHLSDCSGLSDNSKLTVKALIEVQEKYFSSAPAAALEGLPVSGFSGTALTRSLDDSVRGLVRLKTGSLDYVTSMSGSVVRKNGGILFFAVIVNDPENMWEARVAVDDYVSTLADL